MGNWFAGLIVLIVAIALLGKCAGDDDVYDPEVEMAKIRAEESLYTPMLPPTDEGFSISAPSDLGASYRILRINAIEGGNLEVLSRRDGPSGTSFARREIDCRSYTYRYLGEGDTQEEAEIDTSNIGTMSALTGTSASSDAANAACKRGAL